MFLNFSARGRGKGSPRGREGGGGGIFHWKSWRGLLGRGARGRGMWGGGLIFFFFRGRNSHQVINLTQKRPKETSSLFVKRLKSDQKWLKSDFLTPKATQMWLLGLQESLCSPFWVSLQKREKSFFLRAGRLGHKFCQKNIAKHGGHACLEVTRKNFTFVNFFRATSEAKNHYFPSGSLFFSQKVPETY